MAQPVIKTSFASGEWAPKLQGRVDIQKYHAGAALMRNFYVDYSAGGASTRQGTEFINRVLAPGARLIPFQPSSTLSFVLEFGNFYIRFISVGAYVLDDPFSITAITNANPGVVTVPGHNYTTTDEVFISGVGGMTQLNGQYFTVVVIDANNVSLADLDFNPVNTTSFGVYTSGGTIASVTTIASPYAVGDLFPNALTGNPGLKYLQDVTSLIITHPNYPPSVLTEHSVNVWSLTPISFIPTIAAPVVFIATSGAAGTGWTYSYIVTSVDIDGQESVASSVASVINGNILNTGTPITNELAWGPVPGATSYNIYRSAPIAVTGAAFTITNPTFGFISNVLAGAGNVHFQESSPGFAPDFAVGPPIAPQSGTGVSSITVTSNPSLSTNPAVTIAAPPSGVQATATATATLTRASPTNIHVNSSDPTQGGIAANPVGASLFIGGPFNITIIITSAIPIGGITYAVASLNVSANASGTPGQALTTGFTLPNGQPWASPPHTSYTVTTFIIGSTVGFDWRLAGILVNQSGSGYFTPPAVTFSPGGPTATANLGSSFGGAGLSPLGFGNPGVPGFFQERLVLAAPPEAVQTYFMSQPGLFFNFNTSFPAQDDDALSGTIVGEDLNDIRSLIECPTGIIAFTGKGAWLINGGGGLGVGNPITPANQAANPQAFNGANDLRPIKINRDILYGTNKGNYFRDLTYSIYANIYTGEDITTFSNHLFFGHYSLDWAWSEEPFKTAWVVRDDGILLSLGYVKEQELVGWAHHDTDGQFTSVCSVIENVSGKIVDAIYFIVQRLINGQLVQYVERYADRFFQHGTEDAWSVDCGLRTPAIVTSGGVLTIQGNASAVGNTVTLFDAMGVYTSTMATNNWVVRGPGGGNYKITGFTSPTTVTAQVTRVSSRIDPYTGEAFQITAGYNIWQPVTVITGLGHLIGKTVTGLADGVVVPPTVVSPSGTVTLSTPASKVVLGLAYLPQLKTLPLDLGEPTIQSKRKKLPALTLRVADTIGLQAGTSFANALQFKDFQLGNLNIQSNGVVTDLYNGDGRMILDQYWQEPGQVCIQQNLPYPATIVAVIPEVAVGDDK